MTSAAPSRKPYRRAPPQHRETRPPPQLYSGEMPPATPPPPPPPPSSSQPDPSQGGGGGERAGSASPTLSFREEVEILSPGDARRGGGPRGGGPPKSILKRPGARGRKSRSAEVLDQTRAPGRGRAPAARSKSRSLERPDLRRERRASLPGPPASSSSGGVVPGDWNWRLGALEEKVKFSGFLDDITCSVLSPAHLELLGRKQPSPERRGRGWSQGPRRSGAGGGRRGPAGQRPWDGWVSPLHREPCPEQQATPTPCESQYGGEGPRKHRAWPKEEALDPGPRAERRGGRRDPEHAGRGQPPQQEVPGPHRKSGGVPCPPTPHLDQETDPSVSNLSQIKEALSDADRIRILQLQNEELRRCMSHGNHKMESMEVEFENSRHYMQTELSRTQDDLDKMRDKFRRLQNSYTASQRANQDLEEKLHALLRKVERDKKTMDQEIVELTNKLLDAKNTVNRLEELNERYRQDCNLAVQLLKCNKSHFRNHKFSDLPSELQVMVQRHMKSSLPEGGGPLSQGPQEPDTLSLTPADVVPTSVIARVLEKPEPLLLNSAQSCSATRPASEDVFVHVDMTGPGAPRPNGGAPGGQHNGSAGRRPETPLTPGGGGGEEGGGAGGRGGNSSSSSSSFEKLSPYPAPPPPHHPHPLYPGRKVIEFTSDDKVKIPKNSPLPNCTYATRQAISLSLVQADAPPSPAHSDSGWRSAASSSSSPPPPPRPPAAAPGPLSGGSSPFSSPPQPPSSASSEEDLLLSWQRMFVQKEAPPAALQHRTSFSRDSARQLGLGGASGGGGAAERQRGGVAAYSDGEEGSSAPSWTASRESSLDTDSSSVADPRPGRGHPPPPPPAGLDPRGEPPHAPHDAAAVAMATHGEPLTPTPAPEEEEGGSVGSWAEERDVLPCDLPVITPTPHLEYPPDHAPPPPPAPGYTPPGRGQKNPKRMGVHHLHRKDSLTRAQEQGTLLD
ncbi:tight junction-associated protein 1 [Gadus chalcogrammus]|uniref:tight junction-associated protein 1 n=1 Tax=Gadus chalcogrammus TaxID=1042646 RepID=UPI0024C4B417|nr:tight junction-associated protein 1 [Gadus chalcogrammus]